MTTPRPERRAQPRPPSAEQWHSALTDIAPNKILIRGYPLDEMMGRLGFAEAVYLLLMGELPTPSIGKMFDAILVSSIDHGVTPPSTLAARNVATSGAPLKDCVAAGILGFGPHHGGDVLPEIDRLNMALVRPFGAQHANRLRRMQLVGPARWQLAGRAHHCRVDGPRHHGQGGYGDCDDRKQQRCECDADERSRAGARVDRKSVV